MNPIGPPVTQLPDSVPAKSVFKSKTAVVNLIIIAVGAISDERAANFVSAHPQGVLMALGLLGIALRAITKGKVNLFGSDA